MVLVALLAGGLLVAVRTPLQAEARLGGGRRLSAVHSAARPARTLSVSAPATSGAPVPPPTAPAATANPGVSPSVTTSPAAAPVTAPTAPAPVPAPAPGPATSAVVTASGAHPAATPATVAPAARPAPLVLTDVPSGWVASEHPLTSGGLARSYLMIRPPAQPGRSLPVFVILHGRNMSPASVERTSGLLPDLGPAIAVFPAGYGASWNAGGCCGVAHKAGIDDVAFLEQVVHAVLATQADAAGQRVYLIGYSNGGRMAMRLACADTGAFAGLAAVEAVPVAPCTAMAPLPTVLVASTGDPLLTIPTDGKPKVMQGYVEPTVGATVSELGDLDGCHGAGAAAITGNLTTTTWTACSGTGRVRYAQYQGGSHHWPKGDAATPSAQAVITSFLLSPGAAAR